MTKNICAKKYKNMWGSIIMSRHILQVYITGPTRQFWDSGGVKLESLCNFSIVVCQWTVNCLLGSHNYKTSGHDIITGSRGEYVGSSVAVSCWYDTCFAVKTCDGLYHFILSIDRVGIPFHSSKILTIQQGESRYLSI